ncbi:hypothetical protein IAT38_003129 [Cryptococcus sp. DSM 104549]
MQNQSTKRPRSPSPFASLSSASDQDDSFSHSHSRSPSPDLPPPKIHHADTPLPFTCALPPTCHLENTRYATQVEVDRHEEVFHRWVCRAKVRDRDREVGGSRARDGGGAVSGEGGQEREPGGEGEGRALPESFVAGNRRWKECLKVFPEERLLTLHHTETHDSIAKERQNNGYKIFECFLPREQCDRTFATPAKRRLHLIAKHNVDYPQQYFFAITNHGINEIAKRDGLAISMIRPRRYSTTRSQPPTSPSQPTSILPSIPRPPAIPDMDMDDLTAQMGQLESSLVFLPRGVRKAARGKGKGKATAMETD